MREVNAEIVKLSICELIAAIFFIKSSDFDQVFGLSDENGTYNDREWYVLDPKLTLTCIAFLRKLLILYRIGKNTQPVARVGEKIPSALRVNMVHDGQFSRQEAGER